MTIDAAFLSSAKPAESVNGDAAVVRRDDEGRTLFAVVDGLGHGPIAAEATDAAVALLGRARLDAPLLDTLRGVHEALRQTRGAAATVCVVRGAALEACAVGNVQLFALGVPVPLVVSAGVLGHRVPAFRVCRGELRPGARIALASDGISTRVRLDELGKLSPAAACAAIMSKLRRDEDDATILVADWGV